MALVAPRRETVKTELDLEMQIFRKNGKNPRFIYVDHSRFSRLLDEHDGKKLIRTIKPRHFIHQLHYDDIPIIRVADVPDHLELQV